MTTHEERSRALRDGRDLLEAAVGEERLSPVIRSAAALALRDYPPDLEEGLTGSSDVVATWNAALSTTGELIDVLIAEASGEDPLRRLALRAERHFPLGAYLGRSWNHDATKSSLALVFADSTRPLARTHSLDRYAVEEVMARLQSKLDAKRTELEGRHRPTV